MKGAPRVVRVAIPAKAPRTPPCPDPFDVPFLQLAIVGKAKAIVSGDEDLIGIKSKLLCPIVTLEAFLAALPSPEF
jgi:predicted nucleic acid-binding protein